jgi:uncharacterized protein (TIGR03435 family)
MSLKLLIFVVMLPAWLRSQTGATARPSFSVTSVKPNHMDCCTSGGVGDGGSVNRHVTLKGLIGTAYRIQGFRISGGPGWIDTERYDVDGKADDPKADFDQLRLMLRSLLEDRFGLKVHRETRTTAVYALVVDKNGPKIKPSADQLSPDVHGPSAPGSALPNHGALRFGPGSVIGNAVQLSFFCSGFLSDATERVVIDRTKLTGRYDIKLHWAPDESAANSLGNSNAGDSGPSIFTAVLEQLGLRLESTKAPVEVLVIDHAEKPDAN